MDIEGKKYAGGVLYPIAQWEANRLRVFSVSVKEYKGIRMTDILWPWF